MHLIQNNIIYTSSKKEYFKYDLNKKKNVQIILEEYCKILFGSYNYKLRNLLGYTNSLSSNYIYSAFYQNSDLYIHDKEGHLIESKKDFFKSFNPYEIQVLEDSNEVWIATGSGQAVICFDLDSGKEKQIIGIPYEEKSILNFPESIFIFNNHLFVSEMGNQKISTINLATGDHHDYLKFEEPVWDFQKNEFAEIVILNSGIYILSEGKQIKIDIE